jgi:hypothetical protein
MPENRAVVVRLTMLALVIGSAVAACTTSHQSSPRNAQPMRSSATQTDLRRSSDESELRALARNWYLALEGIGERSSTNDPAYGRYLTARLSALYRKKFTARQHDGLLVRRSRHPHDYYRIESTQIGGSNAVIRECIIDDDVLYQRATGRVVNDLVQTVESRTVAVKRDGHWKLDSQDVTSTRTGVTGCALAK